VGDFIDKKHIPNHHQVDLWCSVNGEIKQKGNTSDMIYKVNDLIAYISHIFTLEEYDIILTGTPEGVGPVRAGQTIAAGLSAGNYKTQIEFPVSQRKVAKL